MKIFDDTPSARCTPNPPALQLSAGSSAAARRGVRARRVNPAGGFALMEVLIAVVILAFGLLGLAAMLMTSQKSNNSSYARQQAVQSAYDIVDRMRANSAAAIAGSYGFDNRTSGTAAAVPTTMPSVDCNLTTATCSATQLAVYDIYYWTKTDLGQLPNGSGKVEIAPLGTNNTRVTVTVQWDDGPAQTKLGTAATVGTSNNLAQFIVETLL